VSEVDDAADDRSGPRIDQDRFDELSVELDFVDGQLAQVPQCGVTASEGVDGVRD
jgi:hypothetical protein